MRIRVVHPTDPLGDKLGGIETFLKGFIQKSPDDFDIEFIGTTSDPLNRPLGKWANCILGTKNIRHYPLLVERTENRLKRIPISLRFVERLCNHSLNWRKTLIFFNRIEPAFPLLKINSPKITVLHYDFDGHTQRGISESRWGIFPGAFRCIEGKVLKNMDTIYSISAYTLLRCQNFYPEISSKIERLNSIVDTDIFKPHSGSLEEAKAFLAQTYPVLRKNSGWILFAGRLQETKAPMKLLEAFFSLRTEMKNLQLLFVGDGNLRKILLETVRHQRREKDVVFLGAIDRERLARFYQAADLTALTSYQEAMPVCVLESLASGTPVVSTPAGEIPTILKPGLTGEITRDFSSDAVSEAMGKVLRNRNDYKTDAMRQSVSGFSTENVFKPVYERMRELYEY